MKYSNAIVNIANELNNFSFAIERMKKAVPTLGSDKSLYEALGIGQSTFATWKTRGSLKREYLIDFCINYDVDLNWFFTGKGNIKRTSTNESADINSETKEAYSPDLEDVIKLAMIDIMPEMERANLPFDNESLHTMIKTYLKFKDKQGADVSLILRAVAENEAER